MVSKRVAATLGVCLAIVAGSVDAASLAMTGRFSSHMSGTTTHTMNRLVHGEGLLVFLGISALVPFLCGAALCGAILGSRREESLPGTLALVVSAETVLIAAGGLVMAFGRGSVPEGVTVAFFAASMGLQNTTSTNLLKPYARTTHVTSALTDFGSELGLHLRGLLTEPVSDALDKPELDTFVSAGAVIVSFAAGGALGTAGFVWTGAWDGLCVTVLPALAAAVLWARASAR